MKPGATATMPAVTMSGRSAFAIWADLVKARLTNAVYVGATFSLQIKDLSATVVAFGHVQRKGQQAHHHAFLGLRGLQRDRQRVVGVQAAVHVGNLQRGFVDRGLDGHQRPPCGRVAWLGGVRVSAGIGVGEAKLRTVPQWHHSHPCRRRRRSRPIRGR